MKLGVICPSEIAFRRFLPAMQNIKTLEFFGIGINSIEERYGAEKPCDNEIRKMLRCEKDKAQAFITEYGGKLFDSYESLVTSNEIEAVYIPLPPALHYKWAKMALENGKHVLVEKPATISYEDTKKLIDIAKKKQLAFHENYMFIFHKQLNAIKDIVESGEIGNVRMCRIFFGFPMRPKGDFRYNKLLGGGALIDAGGYTIKCAARILGETAKVRYAQLNYVNDYDVDLYGSGAMTNSQGTTCQLAFGMDNNYKCELEIWGSNGCLLTGRILTAPVNYVPQVIIRKGNEEFIKDLPSDDAFGKSIQRFMECIDSTNVREQNYNEILFQAELVEQFKELAENGN